MVLHRICQSHPHPLPGAFPCTLLESRKPEAGYGKVRGQPLLNDISGVLKEGRALFQAPFAPKTLKPGGLGLGLQCCH